MTDLPGSGKLTAYNDTFREKFWLKLLSSPWVLAPFLAGSSVLALNWALDLRSGLIAFGGVSALLIAGGIFLTRLFTGGDQIGREVAEDIAGEQEQNQTRALDELEKELLTDDDPRNDYALRDLRKLCTALSCEELWPRQISPASRREITANAGRLFASCVELLRKSLDLWRVAQTIATPAARKPILQQRERMMQEVAEGLKQLGGVLAGLHEIDGGASGEGRLERLGQELDESLRIAKAAERRMADIERDLGGGSKE